MMLEEQLQAIITDIEREVEEAKQKSSQDPSAMST
jgi:hypothetical protein